MNLIFRLIDNENPEPIAGANLDWRSYATFDEIQAWLNVQVGQYPRLLTSINIGTSTENRPMRVIRLSAKPVRQQKCCLYESIILKIPIYIGKPSNFC